MTAWNREKLSAWALDFRVVLLGTLQGAQTVIFWLHDRDWDSIDPSKLDFISCLLASQVLLDGLGLLEHILEAKLPIVHLAPGRFSTASACRFLLAVGLALSQAHFVLIHS